MTPGRRGKHAAGPPRRDAARTGADDPHGRPEAKQAGDAGRATIEVVVLAALLLIPTIYVLLSVFRVQAATFAVTQAARDSGRLIDTAPTVSEGLRRADAAARVALADQHVPDGGLRIGFVATGGNCDDASSNPPPLSPGDTVDICVRAVVSLPGVPTVLTGDNNTVTGVYTLRVGDFREG